MSAEHIARVKGKRGKGPRTKRDRLRRALRAEVQAEFERAPWLKQLTRGD